MTLSEEYRVEARLGNQWMVQYRTDRLSIAMRQMNLSYSTFGYETDVRVMDWKGDRMGVIYGQASESASPAGEK